MKRILVGLVIGLLLLEAGRRLYRPAEEAAAAGAAAYHAGDFATAEARFREAEREATDKAPAAYNRAAAQYRLRRFDDADHSYERSAEGEALRAARADYDRGNCDFSAACKDETAADPELLRRAAKQYETCLEREGSVADASSLFDDARHNLELARLILSEFAEQEKPTAKEEKPQPEVAKNDPFAPSNAVHPPQGADGQQPQPGAEKKAGEKHPDPAANMLAKNDANQQETRACKDCERGGCPKCKKKPGKGAGPIEAPIKGDGPKPNPGKADNGKAPGKGKSPDEAHHDDPGPGKKGKPGEGGKPSQTDKNGVGDAKEPGTGPADENAKSAKKSPPSEGKMVGPDGVTYERLDKKNRPAPGGEAGSDESSEARNDPQPGGKNGAPNGTPNEKEQPRAPKDRDMGPGGKAPGPGLKGSGPAGSEAEEIEDTGDPRERAAARRLRQAIQRIEKAREARPAPQGPAKGEPSDPGRRRDPSISSPIPEEPMNGRHAPLAAVLVAALAVPAVAAPPAKVTAQADRKDAQVGQPVLVTVRVRNAPDTPAVKLPAVAGATLAPVGEPTAVPSIIADLQGMKVFHPEQVPQVANLMRGLDPQTAQLLQGQPGMAALNNNDYLFTYQITPERAGQLVVPAFTVTSGGQTTATAPLSVNVSEAKSQPWVRMKLSLSDPTPRVGEEVQLYVDLLIQRAQVSYNGRAYAYLPVSKTSLTLPPLDGSRQVEPAKSLEDLVREEAIEPGKRGFRVNNFPNEVKLEHEPADGQGAGLDPARYRRRLAIPVLLREGGEVTLAPAHAAGEVFVPAGGGGGVWQPFVVASEPLTFSVLDLRKRADRPADFGGTVGRVSVTAEASQTRMPAGTPFTLTVRLQGSGSVASALAPDLASRPEFSGGFRVRLEESRSPAANVREFSYTLRPLNEGVTEVPPVSVSYFDPKSNKFGSARSEAIPLRVTAAANATPDAPAAPAPAPAAEDDPPAGFRADALLPWAEGGIAGLAALCVVTWGVRRFRGPRPAAAVVEPARPVIPAPRPPMARPVALVARPQPLPPPPTFVAVRQLLQDFLRRHFRLPPGEVTPRDAEECLLRGGAPQGLARSVAALLDTCETAEFAPGVVNTSPSDLAGYARQLMSQIATATPQVVV